MNRHCSNCGTQLAEDAKFCMRCGAPVSEDATPVAASAGESRPRPDDAPEATGEDRSKYRRFLKIDTSGGFLEIVAPILIWSAAVGVLTWTTIGLLSLRFDLAFINLPDLLFSMLIIVGIMLSVAANSYLVHSYQGRDGALWPALSYLPMIWAALLSVGLLIMIWQVWTDFAGGPNELRRAMFSLIGVGLCGTYAGYLSLVVIGPDRIYHVLAPGDIRSHGYHRRGDSGCVMVGGRVPLWRRNRGAFHQSRLDRSNLCFCVRHHRRLYGSGQN